MYPLNYRRYQEIDGDYMDKIEKLNMICSNLRAEDLPETQAIQEIAPEMEKLKQKVCSRVRNFLINRINQLK